MKSEILSETNTTKTIPAAGELSWDNLATRIMNGHQLTHAEGVAVLESSDAELLSLLAATYRVRHQAFGNQVQLYYLRNAKSGLCPEDCGYCSQSIVSEAEIPKYAFQNEAKLLEGAKQAAESQARTYCIVASGRGPSDREVEHVASTVEKIKDQYGLHICCCLGILSPDQALRLKAAGVDRINHNLNTSERFHGEITTTHSYQDRLETLKVAREAGLELCSGMIVGMGENPADIVDVALELRELQVESIPLNFLHAIEGTPLQAVDDLNPRACLRSLCMFRLANPKTEIRIAGGREVQLRSLQSMGMYAANSLFVSDYLTTQGQLAEDDFRMIADLGFELISSTPPVSCEVSPCENSCQSSP